MQDNCSFVIEKNCKIEINNHISKFRKHNSGGEFYVDEWEKNIKSYMSFDHFKRSNNIIYCESSFEKIIIYQNNEVHWVSIPSLNIRDSRAVFLHKYMLENKNKDWILDFRGCGGGTILSFMYMIAPLFDNDVILKEEEYVINKENRITQIEYNMLKNDKSIDLNDLKADTVYESDDKTIYHFNILSPSCRPRNIEVWVNRYSCSCGEMIPLILKKNLPNCKMIMMDVHTKGCMSINADDSDYFKETAFGTVSIPRKLMIWSDIDKIIPEKRSLMDIFLRRKRYEKSELFFKIIKKETLTSDD